jgi:nicotinate dehydrogenase subunit A
VPTLRVNGRDYKVTAGADRTLLAVLRDDLDLTGAKYGCGEGVCGACTVLVGGKAVRSCLVTAASVASKPITTIEGLATAGQLHPVQQAFLDKSAFQCGFCTPGMILGAVALLQNRPVDAAKGLQGHICRCGVYSRIVEAVRLAERASG